MQIIKRTITFFLAMLMVFTMIPLNAFASTEEMTEDVTYAGQVESGTGTTEPESPGAVLQTEGGETITRAQWLTLLVETFGYTIDGEILPDNYFPDLLPDAEYYDAVMIAVYYGLVDVLPNSNLRPEAPVTREFAAYTLNICMGYIPQEAYSFSEAATVTYADDIQVAIERGWFALADGAFLPEQPITAAELEIMMADAKEYLAELTIDENHQGSYTFKEGVIEITDPAQLGSDDRGTVITVSGQNYNLAEGDKIVIYLDGLAIPYQVVSSTFVDGDTHILVTDLYFDDVIETMNVQMETAASAANFYAAEDTELVFIEEETGEEVPQALAAQEEANGTKRIYIPKYSKEIDAGEGITLSLNVELKNAKVCYNVDIGALKGSASVWLDSNVEVSAKLSCDLSEISGDGFEVYIGGYEVPGVGGLSVYVKINVTGSISVVKKFNMRVGLKVSFNALKWKATIDRIYKLTDKGSTVNAEITAKICLEAKFGLYGKALPVKGYLYAEAGFKASVKYTTYSEIEGNCIHFAAYLYAEYGAKVEWGMLGFKNTLDWNKEWIKEENSPVKISLHYEDGQQVAECTRTDLHGITTGDPSKIGDSGYNTGADSGYFGSGLSSGGGSKGYNSKGEPVIIYTYSLDDNNNATITGYNGNVTSLTIPLKLDGYKVIAIGNNAFKNKTSLSTIIMQDNIQTVGKCAFYGCTGLRNLTLSNKLTEIGNEAFRNCSSLTTVDLPDSLLKIGENAFDSCGRLVSVRFGKDLTEIAKYAFRNCSSLRKVAFPHLLNTIGAEAFAQCTALTDVYIPISVQEGYVTYTYNTTFDNAYGIFNGCTNLTNVTYEEGTTTIHCGLFAGSGLKNAVLPETVTRIEPYTFAFCKQLETVSFPASLDTINEHAFWYCTSLQEVEFPNMLSTIDKEAFAQCTALTDVYIPVSVQEGYVTYTYNTTFDNAYGIFHGCENLTNVEFQEGTTTIHCGLFAGSGLKNVVLPETVTRIEPYAFAFCKQLESIELSKALTQIDERSFWYCESLEAVTLPDTLIAIDSYAFSRCTGLRNVQMSMKLEKLGLKCFEYCTSLEEILIPNSIQEIWYNTGDYFGPFSYCSSLAKVEFEEGMLGIGLVLSNCTGLKEMDVPDTVTKLNDYAFYRCESLERVTIPDSVTSMGEHVFDGCRTLKEVIVPDSVVAMGVSSFANCTSLQSVTLPASRQNVMGSMFENCTSLESITLPATVTTIQDNAFKNCTALKSITWSDDLTTIGASAFYNCDALTEIVIPTGVTSLGNNCFYDCDALVSVDMANSVTSLGSNAFNHCDLLKNVKLSYGLTTIPSGAFKECAELEEIVIPYFVTKIDGNAFNSSPKLTKVVTHEKLTNIVSSAFSYTDRTVFYGNPDSYTQTWCENNGYTFQENTVTASQVTVAESTMSIANGKNARLDFLVEPNDFSDSISFRSSNTSVVTVDETGKITAIAPGTATIRINVGTASASCRITVTQAVTRITLDKRSMTLEVPETYQLTATVTPSNATNQVLAWTSSNEDAATVDENGVVTAVGNGTAVITATATDGSGISASCTVTVVDPANIPVSSITLDQTDLILEALEECQLTATVHPDNAANQELAWTSSDENVVTVDENGKVVAVAKGTATITVAATDGSGVSASCTVTVVNNAHVVAPGMPMESPHDYPLDCSDFWICTVPGAGELKVTFDQRTYVEDEFDYLLVFGREDKLIGSYTGGELAGVTLEIPGDTVKIRLMSDDVGTAWGFKATVETETGMPKVTWVQATTSLEGNIGLNFYVKLNDVLVNDPSTAMRFIFNGETIDVPLSDAVVSGDQYKFTCPVSAKNMADNVNAQIVTSAGGVGDAKNLAVMTYCNYMISNSSSEKLVNLMKAMLNYGAAAQILFNHNTDNLANASLSEADRQLADVDASAYAHSVSGSEAGIQVYNATLLLETETTARIYFKLTGSKTIDRFTFKVDGQVVQAKANGDLYYVEIPNIAAQHLDEMHTVSVGGLTIRYGGLSYVNQVIKNPAYATEAMTEAAKALFAYNKMAEEYFN